jgi:uncharacterized protein (DUF924 family)
MPGHGEQASEVLEFWFAETRPRQWFAKDPAFDALVGERFLQVTRAAIRGALSPWGEAQASALALSLQAVDRGWLEAELDQPRRQFWLMPLMHAEDLAVQEVALPLFERFTDPRTADFARRHWDVIARFGRFPHRNADLGRVSSPEELAFLETAGSRF